VPLSKALALSLNTVSVRLTLEVGPKAVVRVAHRMGIASKLEPNASIALGTSEVSVMELVSAYVPFANGGIAVAQNLTSEAEVDAMMARAEAAGARILKPAAKTFWGGYDGYFADPDGHVWEVAFNPFWELDEDGRVRLPE